MNIAERLHEIKRSLPSKLTLVVVSKKQPISAIEVAHAAGQRDFGENYIQEMLEKYERLPKDIRWHMIGKVQRNKLKYIAPFVHLIQGIEKLSHLETLDKEAMRCGRTIRCLLQVKIAQEESKTGMTAMEASEILTSETYIRMEHVKVIGLIGMATFTEDEHQLHAEFKSLHKLFIQLKEKDPTLETLSMGMSSDHQTAIACGSTMIRLGSAIFGARDYRTHSF
ncbi:MAG: YggS family pyridoxal phosphate-dependent enzyme [Flavobacteriales bacterium AspAUS03]